MEDVFISNDNNAAFKHSYFEKYIFHLTNILKNQSQDNFVICLHAFDAINSIIQNKNHLEIIKKIVNQIFEILISLTCSIEISQYFDLIQDLFQDYFWYFDKKEVFLDELMKNLNQRILSEMSKIVGSPQLSNIYINKSWNIIRSISENKHFLPNYIEIIEKNLYPLFELLKDPMQIDFDEDIFLLIAEFIKKSHRISSLQRQVFPYLKFYFEKYHCVFGNLFSTIHYYIYYGKDFFLADHKCLDLVILFIYN